MPTRNEALQPADAGPVERGVRPLALMVAFLLSACDRGPWVDGPGALWLYERGSSRCVDVARAGFDYTRLVRYTTSRGEELQTYAPADYRPGERCPAA